MSTEPDAGVDLVARVLAGDNPQLERLAAEGVLPLTQDQVVSLQVRLAQRSSAADASDEIAGLARASLAELDLGYLVQFIRQSAEPELLSHFLQPGTNPALLEAAIQRKGVSPEALMKAAPMLDERAQEVLLLRQDLIT